MTYATIKEDSPDRNGMTLPGYLINGWTPYKVLRETDDEVTIDVHGFALSFSKDDVEKSI